MATNRVGRWEGGYINKTSSGRRVYVIERWQNGKRAHFSTGCATREGARAELARFEADPAHYVPGEGPPAGVLLTAELILAYRDHQLASGLSLDWTNDVARSLGDWTEALKDRDLRALDLHRDLLPALDGWKTQRAGRIKAIKGLFRWLRETRGLVKRPQDVTLDLRVPQARPEKQKRRKVVPPEDVAAVLKHLKGQTRDILHLLTATAWHLSEVKRFAEGGEIVVPLNGEVLAVLITRHKSGDLTKTPILYPEHLEAARRLRAHGSINNRMNLSRRMNQAVKDAGVPPFGLGQMRHSVITWGVRDGGASVEQASEFAQHRSKATTKRFYLDLDVPKNSIPVYRLVDEP